MSTVPDLLLGLAQHADLIDLVLRAVAAGTNKTDIKIAIAAAVLATSDAAMREELEGK